MNRINELTSIEKRYQELQQEKILLKLKETKIQDELHENWFVINKEDLLLVAMEIGFFFTLFRRFVQVWKELKVTCCDEDNGIVRLNQDCCSGLRIVSKVSESTRLSLVPVVEFGPISWRANSWTSGTSSPNTPQLAVPAPDFLTPKRASVWPFLN